MRLFDLSHRAQLELEGNDRTRFLHNFCTNDIRRLKPAEGCEAFVPNIKGHVLAHVFVFCGESSLWIDAIAGAEEGLCAHLDRYIINDDVRVVARTDNWGELLVSGPRAAARIAQLVPQAEQLPRLGHLAVRLNDIPIILRRVDFLVTDGFLILVPRDKLGDVWLSLKNSGVRPAGALAFHVAQIEAGMPLYGTDVTADNLVHEVGRTKRCVSFNKGCYLGQEPIAQAGCDGAREPRVAGLTARSGARTATRGDCHGRKLRSGSRPGDLVRLAGCGAHSGGVGLCQPPRSHARHAGSGQYAGRCHTGRRLLAGGVTESVATHLSSPPFQTFGTRMSRAPLK